MERPASTATRRSSPTSLSCLLRRLLLPSMMVVGSIMIFVNVKLHKRASWGSSSSGSNSMGMDYDTKTIAINLPKTNEEFLAAYHSIQGKLDDFVSGKVPTTKSLMESREEHADEEIEKEAELEAEELYRMLKEHGGVGSVTIAKPQVQTQEAATPNDDNNNNAWFVANIIDYGAIGDNQTDNTKAFHDAFKDIIKNGGKGQVIVPEGGVFQTAPFNITSNTILTVDGIIQGVPDQHKFPVVSALPSYGRCADMFGKTRRHALVHAINCHNITINGKGIIDGTGWYWYPFFKNFTAAYNIGRPHLMEINNCTDIEITGVTLKDSAFWTLHPVYCKNIYIHHMKIDAPSCRNYRCPNTDGIDIDSSENVLIEHNEINVGDDHVTILAGKKRFGLSPPTRNVTVQHNKLGRGMGLAIGSSTAGGVSDVLYYNNFMEQEFRFQFGHGVHIKMRDHFGGYVRNISWIDNYFEVAGKPGGAILIEHGYQRGARKRHCHGFGPGSDPDYRCTQVSDITIRNLTVNKANPGSINCYEAIPCENVVLEDIHFARDNARICMQNVASGYINNVSPLRLFEGCLPFSPNMTFGPMYNKTSTTFAKKQKPSWFK